MAQNNDNTNTALSSAFKSFFDREKLTGSKNFNDWHRSLRIVCRVADRLKYLYEPCPAEPTGPEATQAEKDALKLSISVIMMWLVLCWERWNLLFKSSSNIISHIICSMNFELCLRNQLPSRFMT